MNPANRRLADLFFLGLLVAGGVLVFLLLKSFITPIILAFTVSIIFRPVYRGLRKFFRGNATAAALVTTFIALIIVVVPLFFIVQILFNEAGTLYASFSAGGGLLETIQTALRHFDPTISVDVAGYASDAVSWIAGNAHYLFSSFINIAFGILIMVISLFYILRDGGKLRDRYFKISPLPDAYDTKIVTTLTSAIESVVKGSLVVAILHGIFTGAIGSLIAGFNSPAIWGIIVGLAALIPGIGTALVVIPAIVFQIFTGNVLGGLLYLAWYILAVTFIDNMIMPNLLHRGGIAVHPLIILLGALGGIALLGPVGFIVGPLIMAFFFALLDIYPLIVKDA